MRNAENLSILIEISNLESDFFHISSLILIVLALQTDSFKSSHSF